MADEPTSRESSDSPASAEVPIPGTGWIARYGSDEEGLEQSQVALRRLASANRRVISAMVGSRAERASLEAAASYLERLAAELEHAPHGGEGEGFAETSPAGSLAAFFDRSPVIGRSNPLAPPIELALEHDEGGDVVVVGTATFGSAYEGPPGCVHGGFLAAAFDEILGAAQSLTGTPGMTGTLTVRYRQPTPLHAPLRFEGRLQGVERRKKFVSGRCLFGDRLTAEAEAVFIAIDLARLGLTAATEGATRGSEPSPG
jgi:acyl-coenzyme A thioesterase PaaI-like protein